MNKILTFLICILIVCILKPHFVAAQTGASLLFKSGDYISMDTSLGNFGMQNFTIETWVKVVNTNNMSVITKRPVCAHSNFWSLSIVSSKFVFEVDENASGLNYNNPTSTSSITPGNWYHVAITRSGLTLRLYVNGVLETSVTQPNITNLNNTVNMKIGQGPCSSFIGQIDETRIWNRALSACEINSYRTCEIATSFNGLLANYHFNQGTASANNSLVNTLLDASGNARTGNLTNFTLSGSNSNWVSNGAVTSGQSCTNTSKVPRAYITNQSNTNVLVYDLNTNTEITKVNIGSGGYGVTCTPNGESVYVANTSTDKVCVIDAFTHTLKTQISVGLSPFGICMKSDGSRVYSINSASNSVSVINTTNNTVVATIPVSGTPFYGACSPNGQFLYVSRSDLNAIAVINTSTNTIVSTVNVGLAPRGVAVSPDGTKIYVCNATGNTVTVIQASTNTVVATIPVGTTPIGVAVSPQSDIILVSNINSSNVSRINALTNTVTTTYTVGITPRGISFSQDGKKAYVSNAGSNTVSEINLINNTVSTLPNIISASGNSSIGQFVHYGNQVVPVSACGQYVYGGNTLTSSGLYSANFTSVQGCDSTQTIDLQITPNTMPTPNINVSSTDVCAGGSASMNMVSSYCIPTLANPGNTNDYISSFNFNNQFVNTSGDGDYTLYPFYINVIAGNNYSVHLNAGAYPQRFVVFIDYNRDGDFIDANEFVWSSSAASTTASGNFTIPSNARNGNTRLRVMSCTGNVPNASNSCSYIGLGEYEDYQLTISGGMPNDTYSWSPAIFLNASNQASVTASGMNVSTTYTVTVTDNNGCSKTATKTINVNPIPSTTILASTTGVCTGGSTQLQATTSPNCIPSLGIPGNTNDYISNFNFDNQIVNTSGDGDYTFYPITADATAGNTYSFNLTGGGFVQRYALFIDYNQDGDFTDVNEFVWSTLNYASAAVGTLTIPLNAFNGITRMRVLGCYGQILDASNACSFNFYGEYEDYQLHISGALNGNTYSWSPTTFLDTSNQSTVTASGINANTNYTVIVTNNFGCSDTASQNINIFPINPITVLATNTSLCSGLSTQLEATAAYCTPVVGLPGNTDDYIGSFNFDNQIINNSGDGDYTYYPLSANVLAGNTYSFNVSVGAVGQIFALFIDYNQDGDFTDANEFVWTSGSSSNAASGNVMVPATARNGKTRMRLMCNWYYAPNAQNACSSNSQGEYEDYNLIISGGAIGNTYSWSPNSFLNTTNQVSVTASAMNASTTYTVTATDDNGCTSTATKSINVLPIPSVNTFTSNASICNGASTQLAAALSDYCTPTLGLPGNTGDYINLFSFDNQIINSSGDGDYTYYPLTANVSAGNTYYFNLSSGPFSQKFALYIDYNQDGDFTDADEFVWHSSVASSISANITIPTNVRNGITRMRVMCCWTKNPTAQYSCTVADYGEYEDYRLYITGGQNGGSFVWTPATYLNTANQNVVTASNVTANTTYTVTATNANGCTATSTVIINVNPCTTNHLQVKCFIEGYAVGSGLMQAVKMNQGIGSNANVVDDITLEIKENTSPFNTISTCIGELQTNGNVHFNFNPIPTGMYYIVLKYRNSIETWSEGPIPILTSSTYDFTSAANKAYGSNQQEIANGVWALYSGDINQDGAIDAFDYLIQDPDIINGESGYLATDLNGDGIVDSFDYLILDPNILNGVGLSAP